MPGGDATITVGGDHFKATAEAPFVFGRADNHETTTVGLDPTDMGISAEAGSIEFQFGLWWVVNRSGKRPLLIEPDPGSPTIRLAPGERSPLTRSHTVVLVPGGVYTHRLDVHLPPETFGGLLVGRGPDTGTITFGDVRLSERDRTALAALFRGYLESFPRRDARPLSYQQAADLLGPPWTQVTVRKQIERLKERLARGGLYLSGPRANDELADHLIGNGMLTAADLSLLPGRDG